VRNSLLLLTCAAVAWAGAAGAAESTATAPKKAVAKPAAEAKAPVKGPRIAVEPAEHDFGKALQNKTLTKEFSVKNYGTEDLVISNVATTCGCTVAQLSTKTLKPGASTPLVVNLETRANSGALERTITIESNDSVKKLLDVKVKVDVAPEKPAAAAR
jgi:hypothetical protein